jgi:hypothetical protein
MKRGLFILTLLINFSLIEAQNDFRQGFIILNTGDTIFGKIDFRSDLSNGTHIFFKKDSISISMEYTPDLISAYRFLNDKFYISKKVKVGKVERPIFLECLISGRVNVYFSVQEGEPIDINKLGGTVNEGHYYIEKDTLIREIDNNSIMSKDMQYTYNTNQYKNMLKVYFSDYPDIFKEVDKLGFNKKSLINISKKYNEAVCKDKQCVVYEKPFAKRIYQFGFETGYEFSKLDYYINRELSFETNDKYDFNIGAFCTSNLDNDYRYILQLNLKYREQEYNPKNGFLNLNPGNYKYKLSSFISDLLLKYRFSLSRLKPNIFAGGSFGEIIDNQYDFPNKGMYSGNWANNDKFLYGLFLGTGIDYNYNSKTNIFLSLKYEYIQSPNTLVISVISVNAGCYF